MFWLWLAVKLASHLPYAASVRTMQLTCLLLLHPQAKAGIKDKPGARPYHATPLWIFPCKSVQGIFLWVLGTRVTHRCCCYSNSSIHFLYSLPYMRSQGPWSLRIPGDSGHMAHREPRMGYQSITGHSHTHLLGSTVVPEETKEHGEHANSPKHRTEAGNKTLTPQMWFANCMVVICQKRY